MSRENGIALDQKRNIWELYALIISGEKFASCQFYPLLFYGAYQVSYNFVLSHEI